MTELPAFDVPAPLEIAAFTLEAMKAYLDVSGDVNPLHADPDLAARIGLAGIPIPGMLMMAKIADYVASWPRCEETLKLDARFIAPIYVGDAITLAARLARRPSEAQPHPILRIIATQTERLVIVAEAKLALV